MLLRLTSVVTLTVLAFLAGCEKRRAEGTKDISRRAIVQEIQDSVATARTVRVARSVADAQVNRVLALENADERLSQMKLLAHIVAERPIDGSTPSNRAFSHEVRFVMGLEVFDGFVKLGEMDEAWSGLLGMLARYQDARDEARKEFEERAEAGVEQNMSKEKRCGESALAREYYSAVQSGYAAAKEFTRLFVIPNMRKKYPLPKDVMERLTDATR